MSETNLGAGMPQEFLISLYEQERIRKDREQELNEKYFITLISKAKTEAEAYKDSLDKKSSAYVNDIEKRYEHDVLASNKAYKEIRALQEKEIDLLVKLNEGQDRMNYTLDFILMQLKQQ